ncbi:MAG: COQ9 family protein [Pelagimonas sp.]|uniref:COQ9 family protein n=1 Tax=Pelagimonas sp. TaxID=2073170 RepID=UPI003D6BCBA4
MTDQITANPIDALLDAALIHVPFDGWNEETFVAAIRDSGLDATVARGLCPRGALDLAILYHQRGDDAMVARMEQAGFDNMRIRDKVTFAVRARIEAVDDRELVQRGTTLFALPQNAADGAKLIWGTSDRIWSAMGDSSRDLNWYSKRATLSAVYSSVVLYWLGDQSEGHSATWEFLDRRIENVMQFEKTKAAMRKAPVIGEVMTGLGKLFEQVKAPDRGPRNVPGGRPF